MEIILKADVPHLGQALDVVKVRDGYARNYLFPRKLAVLATRDAKVQLERNRAALESQVAKERAEAQALVAKLEEASVSISAKVHEGEKLYGSVTAHDIAENLKAQGFKVEKRTITLEQPIRALGVYTVKVRPLSGIEGKIKVWVVKAD
jgi:large subunit ribosomal protein L9